MNTALHVCPRCEAFVQPDWPSCKICGYDPRHADQYPDGQGPARRRSKRRSSERMSALQVLGALVTLAVLVVAIGGAALAGKYLWTHRDPHPRQEFVTFEK